MPSGGGKQHIPQQATCPRNARHRALLMNTRAALAAAIAGCQEELSPGTVQAALNPLLDWMRTSSYVVSLRIVGGLSLLAGLGLAT
jgi:hypothetical protein